MTTNPKRRSLPWGLLGAILLLLPVEASLRVLQPEGRLSSGLDSYEYRFLPRELARSGSPPIVFIGSSRTREGASIPTLKKAVWDATGATLAMANYGMSAAAAGETLLAVRQLLRATPRPELVLYGVGPRQLRPKASMAATQRHMVRLPDWGQLRLEEGEAVDACLGDALRNSLGDRLHLFRYLPEIRRALEPGAKERRKELKKVLTRVSRLKRSPMLGYDSTWNQSNSSRQSKRKSREYLARVFEGEPPSLDEAQRDRMDRAVTELRAAGIEVVLFEAPTSPSLSAAMPAHLLDEVAATATSLAQERGVPYLTVEQLGVKLKKKEWREHSHLNLLGARRMSRALAKEVVVPWVERRAD